MNYPPFIVPVIKKDSFASSHAQPKAFKQHEAEFPLEVALVDSHCTAQCSHNIFARILKSPSQTFPQSMTLVISIIQTFCLLLKHKIIGSTGIKQSNYWNMF